LQGKIIYKNFTGTKLEICVIVNRCLLYAVWLYIMLQAELAAMYFGGHFYMLVLKSMDACRYNHKRKKMEQ